MIAPAQRPSVAQPPTKGPLKLKFKNSTMDIVLQDYSEKTNRTILPAPGLPKASITLEGQNDLTLDEYLLAIDTVLAMNGITLLTVGEKFLKVVPIGQGRTEEMPVRSDVSPPRETSQLVSQMIPLKYINITEAQTAINALKHTYAQVHMFERINSILLTDTAANVARIMEVLGFIDQPAEAKEEPIIIPILFAKASDIKQKLEELIAESQKESTVPKVNTSGPPGVQAAATTTRTVPGVIRARTTTATTTKTGTATGADELIEMVEKGLIIGKVKIIADDRTNILILITRKENMKFFDKIIKVLDIETAPDVIVKVFRLEYADAETVASTINNLIGGKVSTDKPKDGAKSGETAKGEALAEYVQKIDQPAAAGKEKSKVGELSSSNVKILSDKRTNSLLVMASKADLAALQDMIMDMDIMLSQVLVEVVIFQISLNDSSQRGVDWVQRALMAYEQSSDGAKTPKVSWAGTLGGGQDTVNMQDPLTLSSLSSLSSLGASKNNLTYFFSFYDVSLDAIIKLVSSDSRTKIVASPQVLTSDNKPGTLSVTQERSFYNGQKWLTVNNSTGGSWQPDYQMKKIGTKLIVTPRINEKKFVVMEIAQTFERIGTPQDLGSLGKFDTIDASEFNASVAVRSGETIVLGGMIDATKTTSENKVPLLGDLPIIGNLFKYKSDTDNRAETMVFITPYVLNTPAEIERETERMRNAVDADGIWPKGWSNSNFAYAKKPVAKHGKFIIDDSDDVASAQPGVESSKMPSEMQQFIERHEKRWNRAFKEVDEQIDREMKEQEKTR